MLKWVAAVVFALVAGPALAQQFPVTIEHSYGETTIVAAPLRVVTWGWSGQEALLALGVVPVGMPSARSEGFDEDVPPWTAEVISKLGGHAPTILEGTGDVPIEQIAALKPDLIFAPYSGLTAGEYSALSGIAPVVPSIGAPWTATWQEVIDVAGEALGKPEQAQAIVADLEQFIAEEGGSRPHLKGTRIVTVLDYNNALAIHSADDARIKMLVDAGMVSAEKPAGAGPSEAFWYPLSYELFDTIRADVVIAFFSSKPASAAFLDQPFSNLGPWKKNGSLVVMDDRLLNMSIIPGNALSLKWGLSRYLDLIEKAAEARKQ